LELNKIYNEDCFKVIEKIPDESIDLILTDPPYGDNIGYGRSRSKKEILNNENEGINYRILTECYPKLKNNSNFYIFTNWKFVENLRTYITKETFYTIRMMLVIVKNNFGMGYGFRNQYELCLVLEKGDCVYRLNNFSNVVKMGYVHHDIYTHPHEKSVGMLMKMIKHSTDKNDIIFDGFSMVSWDQEVPL
jgi:DNA modification methylase